MTLISYFFCYLRFLGAQIQSKKEDQYLSSLPRERADPHFVLRAAFSLFVGTVALHRTYRAPFRRAEDTYPSFVRTKASCRRHKQPYQGKQEDRKPTRNRSYQLGGAATWWWRFWRFKKTIEYWIRDRSSGSLSWKQYGTAKLIGNLYIQFENPVADCGLPIRSWIF